MAMASVSGAAEAGCASAAGPPRVYRFTDDALDDAVALLAALGQHGIVPVGATAILKAKRTLGSDDWDHEAELDFWHAYAGLAACFRTDPALAPVLTDFLAAH